jgi:hypothetical protein
MSLDFNDALPWPFIQGAMDAHLEVSFERFLDTWLIGYSQYFDRDEPYDVRDTRENFLKFCAEEFDRTFPVEKKLRHAV